MPEQEKTQTLAQTTNQKSLKAFIDENDKLFTAIGVMGALATIFTTLKNGEYLAFLSFVLLYILDFQLFWLMPKIKNTAISLALFQVFFQALLGAIAAYVIQQYPKYFVLVIPTITGFASSAAFIFLRRKYSHKISILLTGTMFTILMLIYYIATLFFHVSFS